MRTLSLACALFLATMALACNAGNKPGNETTTQMSAAKIYLLSSVGSRKDASLMTDFSWSDGGKTVSLSEIAKDKIVFLNFWGTWCPPCRHEIPDIVAISKEMAGKVVVIGVALENGRDAQSNFNTLSQFAAKNDIPYINVTGDRSAISELGNAYGGIPYVPMTFIIKNGKIVSSIQGGSNKENFMKELEKVI